MKRVVCDTNVIVSGMLWRGAPRQVLIGIEQEKRTLFISRVLLDELDRVLRYPRLLSVLGKAGLARQDILRWVVRHATLVMPKPLGGIVISSDPPDDHVLTCAVSAAADVIVSGDRHILDVRSFRGIPILTPSKFLQQAG